jgi:galactokinase
MNTPSSRIRISTPGRVCLFGEHQDYLHLPVVPCAISLRVAIEGAHRNDDLVRIGLPDISREEIFSVRGEIPYVLERDYFRSTMNVMKRKGFTFSRGLDCVVRGNIPINAGTSSSSALVIGWVNLLARTSDQARELTPMEIATLAHAAEVLEFGEPGGMMDHFSTAFGGVIAIDFFPFIAVDRLSSSPGTFVLGDSGEPKDTKGILARVKNRVLDAVARLAKRHETFSLQTADAGVIRSLGSELAPDEQSLLLGTLRNRDITRQARAQFHAPDLDRRQIGRLLSEHQTVLREVLGISTPKIDRMIAAAEHAGAYGGKINGSGGGGCMFAYAPEDPERVARAIEGEGGKAYIVSSDEGTRAEQVS